MPRKPRREEAGALHHVYAHAVADRALFRDDDDRRLYLDLLASVVERFEWRVVGYCLMDNHIHLIVETPEPTLGRGMQRLHGMYAAAFNRRHGLSGHVFQGRYGNVRVTADDHFWALAGYVALNPVKAGMCERAEDHVWSSCRQVLCGRAPWWLAVTRLLELMSAYGTDPRRAYADVVAAPTPPPRVMAADGVRLEDALQRAA